ncbi:gluconokinase [Pantanalinema rosaneae CENA516]|uniref:gluconokinase n=1 Tax=Pantanalinema rosaneae TaxID=1620701 RepID=UPI003D6E08BE
MHNPQFVIGIDIGTSSTKSVLFDTQGRAIQKHLVEYPLYSPVPLAAEQDPNEVLQAVLKTVKQVIEASQISPSQILCLTFSAAMHSLIAIDAQGQLLTNSLTWADARSGMILRELQQLPKIHELYDRTGTILHSMAPLVKLVWLRKTEPDIFKAATKFISIKEYIFYQLFHRFVVDYAIASATGLLNLETFTWDTEALTLAEIRLTQLSELVPPTCVLQPMRPEMADAMGLRRDIPVVVGASDGALSNLGLGAIHPGSVAMTIGTSGAVRTIVHQPVTDPQRRLFCYAFTEQHWLVGGASNNGGIVLRWLRDQLAIADRYEALLALAETVPPGAAGLLFHPYILGERSPLWTSEARGSFFGLTINHTKAHLVRAVLEGMLFNLLLSLQALQSLTGQIDQIRASGGLLVSSLCRQMMADIFDREIIVPAQPESSCLGAAVLGLYAFQMLDSLESSSQLIQQTCSHQPLPQNVALYQRLMPLYQQILEQSLEHYHAIAQLQIELNHHYKTNHN